MTKRLPQRDYRKVEADLDFLYASFDDYDEGASRGYLFSVSMYVTPELHDKLEFGPFCKGLIEKTTRTSRSSATGTAAFNSLTETGLVDGRNETSRQNPNATQVRLYADKFRELLARIEAQVEAQPQTGKRSLVAHADQPSAGGAA